MGSEMIPETAGPSTIPSPYAPPVRANPSPLFLSLELEERTALAVPTIPKYNMQCDYY